ncbi:MAG: PEP-CTERM sorting domain-containing protein [Candidatus Omnitrophica bacterium]|nr:PEP-CTERM sorting domain-containing protein [Candidatus Omnitrophota bacterium]
MRKILVCLTVGVMLMFISETARAANTTIDEFDNPSFVELLPAYGTTEHRVDTGLPDVIGGSRQIDYTRYSPGNTGLSAGTDYSDSFYIKQSSAPGQASMSTSASNWGEFYLTYDANGSGLNTDFSQVDQMEVNFWVDHLGFVKPSAMSIMLTDGNGTSYEQKTIWSTNSLIDNWLTESFPLAEYAAHGVNLTDVDQIRFYYEGDQANDASFDNIRFTSSSSTPEPASMILFGIGGIAMAGIKKLRKRPKK